MKMTLDLPESLVRAVKLRARREGRGLKEVAREALTAGLTGPRTARSKPVKIVRDKKTGLPVIKCGHSKVLTPRKVADLLISQEGTWAHDLG